MSRKLASLQKVIGTHPIEGADRIEVVQILGWECVVLKDENFKADDLAVYFEIDSLCPEKEPFLFLAQRKYRIKAQKLRGVVSYGLTMPLSAFPEIQADVLAGKLQEGDDLTERLGVVKYDPEAQREREQSTKEIKHNPLREFFMQFAWFRALHRKFFPGKKKGWPEFIRKTDETRLQNMPHVLNQTGKMYYATEKLDGQSGSYFLTKTKGFLGRPVYTFGVCSRNIYHKTRHSCTWWNIAEDYMIEDKLRRAHQVFGDICIQGEIVGPGVQGNKYQLPDLQFFVFNVFDVQKQRYFEYHELLAFCNQYDFAAVPVLDSNWQIEGKTVQDVLGEADGKSQLNSKVAREGLVIRSKSNMTNGEPISFKAVSPSWLLKFQDADV